MLRLHLKGPMSQYTGYGVGFTGLVRRLVNDKRVDFELSAVQKYVPDYVKDDLRELLAQKKNYHRLGVLFGYGDSLLELPASYRVLYTMYETTNLPYEWVSCIESANEVWVPTSFCAKLFSEHTNRIRIVPWGYDDAVYRKKRKLKHNGFVFGTLGVMSKRKGVDVLVEAFNKAFGANPEIQLLIKTRDTRWMPGIDNPQITVLDADWDESQLVDFYRGLDCFVLPTRGEGVGMPPLQAAAVGVPTLVTNWSGPADYIDDNGIWGIRIKGMSTARGMAAKCTQWAEPDVDHLIELMQWVYETRPKVKGNYHRWTLTNMTNEFVECCYKAGRICYGNNTS